jgi:putative membrane protein
MRVNKKKMAAAGISVLLASGLLVGSVEYASHTFALSKAAAAGNTKTVTESVNTKAAKKADASKVSKEETVYVTMDANGKKDEVIVSDWLKNAGINGKISDVSDLKDIQNTKGNEKFTQDDSTLTWDAKKNDIYYQGTSDKELPVGMEISYKLDGKEVSAKDLAGKSGKFEMNIKYTNSSKKKVTVDGKETEIYTPFLMATGMILSTDKFQNIKVDNGEVVSEGDNDIIMAYGMPGLKDSLDLAGLDFGDDVTIDTDKINDKITDTVKITADVKDFEMGASYTVATASLFKDIDFGDIDSLDDLDDKMDDLKDAANKLVDGADTLSDGLKTLNSNIKKYNKAIKTLNKSVGTLNTGATKLKKGVGTYTKSADKLFKGVIKYSDGTKTFAQSTKKYTAGAKALVDGAGKISSSAEQFPASYKQFNDSLTSYVNGVNTLLAEENMTKLSSGVNSLKAGVESLDSGLTSAISGVDTINAAAKQLEGTDAKTKALRESINATKDAMEDAAKNAATEQEKATYQAQVQLYESMLNYMDNVQRAGAGLDAATNGKPDSEAADQNGKTDLKLGLQTMEAATSKTSTETNLYNGLSALQSSAKTMSDSAATIRGYKTPILEASGKINASVGTLTEAVKTLYKSGTTLTANNKKLNDAATTLTKSSKTVKSGSKQLKANSGTVRSGMSTLAGGTKKLYKATNTLVTTTNKVAKGVNKLDNGASKLASGTKEFKEDGVDKLTDTMNSILDGVSDTKDRAEAVNNAAANYKSFSGISGEMDGSVKFIMTTKEIKADD